MLSKTRRDCQVGARLLLLTFAGMAAIFSGPANAQSFDCGGKLSQVERWICDEPVLSGLDFDLERVFQRVLKPSGAERDALLTEQRTWIKERNATCTVEPPREDPRRKAVDQSQYRWNYESYFKACLDADYRARIDSLSRRLPADDAAREAPCHQIIDAYSAAIAATPKSALDARPRFAGSVDPMAILGAGENPIVSMPVRPAAEGDKFHDIANFNEWSQTQSPPFRAPSHGWNAVDKALIGNISIDRLPGADVYTLSSISGTLSCYQGAFTIQARKGDARYIGTPDNWGVGPGDGCQVIRQFGTVSGKPAAIQIGDNSLKTVVSVAPWGGDRFDRACIAEFDFAPVFSVGKVEPWGPNDVCPDDACHRLRQFALEVIPSVQRDPAQAREEAIAKLDGDQRRRFSELIAGADARDCDLVDSAHSFETASWCLPMAMDGVVYRATFRHAYIGDILVPDWAVTLSSAAPSEQGDDYSFTIGVDRGRLLATHVE